MLQSCWPSKEVPQPRPGNVPKSTSESAGPNGVQSKMPKRVLRIPSPMLPLHRHGAQNTCFGTLLGTPFRTSTFRSTFLALFLAGASLFVWIQELRKGGFSKGGFCRIRCHPQETKTLSRALGSSLHSGLGAPQSRLKRGVYVCKTPF